ncbi:AfsR/SARP family transcriptional regulator [Kitasatospora azatica]|uniref:AfsR/SARP family transcriptional regulator n=1 Tax=Kitasatospora azatica TaxID=58347 RepID=UPI00068BC64E|nr:AfsR/SARP family transcriptional regulator [Kitasatospora azatica]
MEFGLLGPLLVDTGQGPVAISAPKQRIVLAALLLQANKVVSTDRLTELLWQGQPPPTARAALQNHVMRLRTALGPVAAERLLTRGPGYLIEVHPGELDLDRFLALSEDGAQAAAEGRWSAARALLDQALAQWRDQVLLDVPAEALLLEVGDHLAERRAQTLADRIDADLALGRHEAVLTEIRGLIERQPLNERLHSQLMLALYRSGRQADALACYRELRALLVAELGIEPGCEVTELHQRMLRSDASLLLPAPAALTATPEAPSARIASPPRPLSRPRLLRAAAAIPLAFLLLGGATAPRAPAASGRITYVTRTGSAEDDSSTYTTTEVPVLNPVTAGDALIVTLMLTSTTPGEVTVTDTAGDRFTAVGDVTDHYSHRTMVFAAFNAKALGNADQITANYPRSSKYHMAVDEFRGIGAAGGQGGASSLRDATTTSFSTSAAPVDCAAGDLLISAVGSNSKTQPPVFVAGWQTLPVLKLSSYRLTDGYRLVTQTGHCAAAGTTTQQWEAVLVVFH